MEKLLSKLIPLREFSEWNSISWDLYFWCNWYIKTWIVYISPSLAAESFFSLVSVSREKNKTHKKRICNDHDIKLQHITSRFQSFYGEFSNLLAIFDFILFITNLIIKDDKPSLTSSTRHILTPAFSNNVQMYGFVVELTSHRKSVQYHLDVKKNTFQKKWDCRELHTNSNKTSLYFSLSLSLTYVFDQTN